MQATHAVQSLTLILQMAFYVNASEQGTFPADAIEVSLKLHIGLDLA